MDNTTNQNTSQIETKEIVNTNETTVQENANMTTNEQAAFQQETKNTKINPQVLKLQEDIKKIISKIPYFGTPDMPLLSTTQNHTPIADIIEDVVIFKDGSAAIVLESSSLNFGLLSEKEQQAVVAAFAALINSLSFAIQIVVRTQRKDISGYIKYFDEQASKITNPKLLGITENYRHFITESIKKKTVLGKRFFIVIPFSSLELGIAKSAQSLVKAGPLPFPKDYVLKKAKTILFPKKDHLIRQAGRLGLKLKQLSSSELIDLYYQVNNPEPPAVKKDI